MLKKLAASFGFNPRHNPTVNVPARTPAVVPQDVGNQPPNLRRRDHRPAALMLTNQRQAPDITLLDKAMQLPCMPVQGGSVNEVDIASLMKYMVDEFDNAGSPKQDIASSLKDHFVGIDQVFDVVENRTGSRMGPARFEVKKAVLNRAIEKTNGKPMDVINALEDIPYFRGKYAMLIDVARERMERDVRSYYSLPQDVGPNPVRRLYRTDLKNITQGEYVLHVCGLFNLENTIDQAALEIIYSKLDRESSAALSSLEQEGASLIGVKFKHAVPFLLSTFPVKGGERDIALRNSHPASVMLQVCSGLIFHLNNQVASLTDEKSPLSFEKISHSMALKYFESEHHGKLHDFFDSAFVAQAPCYEATVENILNFTPQPDASNIIFGTKPEWDNALSIPDNINGLLAWVERELIRDFAASKSIELSGCTLEDVNKMEGSGAFAKYLVRNEATVVAKMLKETGTRAPKLIVKEMVRADLELGLKSAT